MCRAGGQAGHSAPPPPPPPLLERLRAAAAAVALSAALSLAPLSAQEAQAAAAPMISANEPVLDLARVVPRDRLDGLQDDLRRLEQ